jgi:predicted alpha/beta-hydrolase family hydrolase
MVVAVCNVVGCGFPAVGTFVLLPEVPVHIPSLQQITYQLTATGFGVARWQRPPSKIRNTPSTNPTRQRH